MKKSLKVLAIVLCAVLLMAIGAGLTLALLQDTDGQVNVMTLGSIDIVQNETDRNGNPFKQDQLLLPSYYEQYAGDGVLIDNENAIDKFVSVTNTGKSEAYVRTVFAVEVGQCRDLIHLVLNDSDSSPWYWQVVATDVELDGDNYDILVATLRDPLAPGETTANSLLQVYLDVNATNADVASFGENYQIRVFTQAVQTTGFQDATWAYTVNVSAIEQVPVAAVEALNYAFKPVTAENHPWASSSVWDGSTEATIVEDEEEDNTYYINSAEEMANFALRVSGGETFQGKTVKLNKDIDLMGNEWTPIGTSTNKFQGHFDGQNHTVSNLVITGNNNYVGLFGYTSGGTVKNLTIHNASVSGRVGVGALAGSPYTTKYDNITLTGNVKIEGLSYVGGLLGRNAYANVSNITVNANAGSYVKAVSIENGTAYRTYVGGVIGFMGEGGHVVSNVKSNLDVIGSTLDIGGITGIAHYGNVFENIVCTGNVTLTNYDPDENLEIGGIAGVWHNQNGTTVTMNNCTFTGTLTVEDQSFDLSANVLTGTPYSATGTGKLIINGVYPVVNADELANAAAAGKDIVLSEDIVDAPVNTTAPYGNYYGIALNGGVLDGNGKALDFNEGELHNGKLDNYGIMTSGGTIKNTSIGGVFRGIMIMDPTEDVIIDNVVIGDEDVCYAINTGEGDGTHSLYVSNSTIKGWSSYGTAIKDLYFTNCTFAQGEYYTNVFGRLVKPYVDTVFDSCEFNSMFYIDLSQLGKDGDGHVLNPNTKIVLKNCTVNGVKLTAENWTSLIVSENDCGAGQISIELKDGSYLSASNIVDYVVIE